MEADLYDPTTFREEWSRFYRENPPLAWVLRSDSTLPWLRYHALPGSKRYAEDDTERAIIFARASSIGDRILGSGNPCWLVEACLEEKVGSEGFAGAYSEGNETEDAIWYFYARSVQWHSEAFAAELRAIAEDRLIALWMGRTDGAVFAPYDGGFDIFPSSLGQVETLKAERSEWLSSYPGGL